MTEVWKITIVGGSSNGMDYSFPADREVLVGRSSKVDLKLSEGDVSGRHLKLAVSDGVAMVYNLSARPGATRHNGVEMEPERGATAVSAGDTVTLGANSGVRVRFDAVPESEAEFVDDDDAPTMVNAGAQPRPADDDGETVVASNAGMFVRGDDDDSATSVPDDESGETRDLKTRQGDMAEILALKKEFEARRKKKHASFGGLILVVSAALAAVWFLTKTSKDVNMSIPLRPDGKPDIATYAIRDTNSDILLKVDFPRDPGMSVTVSPDSNGVSVVSCMGRERDVPFFLKIESLRAEDELRKDLVQSARDWIARAEASGSGYVFDMRVKEELKFEFFEDVFPGSCQKLSLYGVKFVTFDYKRTWPDGELWHGVLIYFRRGDTAFVHRREIPERYWVRGSYRILQDPNIAVYANFIDSYWESPGLDNLPMDRSIPSMMASIEDVLSKERASDWPFARRELDAILVKTWRTDGKTRERAEGYLRQFRELLRTFYYGKYNAYQTAKDNGNERRMARFRADVTMVFQDPNERFYHLVSNGGIW